jgi:hypothetical protein
VEWSPEIKVIKPYSNPLLYKMLVQSLAGSLCIIMWNSIKLKDETVVISLGYNKSSISKKMFDVTANSRMKQIIKCTHYVTVLVHLLSFA